MSPSTTRRGARSHRPETAMRRATGTNHGAGVYDVPSSSDGEDDRENDDNDGDDDIPADISPPRVVANASGPSLPSLRPSRPLKRHLDDATLSHSAGSKKPRGRGVAPSPPRSRQQGPARKATGLASPTPSRKVPTPNNRVSRSVSRVSPSATDVDPELFALVNSKMLKRRPVEDPLSPGAQLRLEEARQGLEREEGEGEENAEKEIVQQDEKAILEGEEQQQEEEARERTEHGPPELDEEAIQNELRYGFASIGNRNADEYIYTNIEQDSDIDLAVGPTSWTNGNTNEELDENESGEDMPGKKDSRSASQFGPETDADDNELPDANFAIARQVDNVMITLGDQHSHGDPFEFVGSPDLANHDDSAATSKIDSDVDFEVESDLGHEHCDLSLEERLVQDIDKFRSKTGGFEDSLLFEPPEAPSSTTIHLSSSNVEKLCQTIEKKSWVGRAKEPVVGGLLDWETKLQDDWRCSESKTAVGKVLFHFTGKIDRLLRLVFMIPTPETRNQAFSEHFDLLQYCFSMVENSISFIRDQRLSSTNQTPLNENKEKREEMVEEIARFHIPVIFQLLMRIWTPCSEDERRSSFDSFIVLLLTRVVGWIEQLYRPFIRVVRSAKGSTLRMKTREEFETPLKELRTQLGQAPELLEQEEELQAQQRRWLKSQKVKRLQLENEEERRLEARRRQNEDVAIFLKYEVGRKPEARRRQNRETSRFGRQEHPIRTRHTSEQVQSSAAARGAQEAIWQGEEERVLCEKLISSFVFENPKLPDLRQTATLIGHTREETVDKARELLQAILSRGSNNMLGEEQVRNRVQSIMRQWE